MIEYDVVHYSGDAPFVYCGYKSLEDAKKQYDIVVKKYPKERTDIIKANIVEGYHFQDTREVIISTLHEQLSLFEV